MGQNQNNELKDAKMLGRTETWTWVWLTRRCLCSRGSLKYWTTRPDRDIALQPPFSDRSTVAVGTFVTKLIAFAATRGRKGRWDTTKSLHRANYALPRQVRRVKRCTATTQYCLLFLGLFPLWSEDKERSITACLQPAGSFMGRHNTVSVYIKQHTKALPRNQFPVTFMNKNLIHLPLNTFIKSWLETYYQTVPTSTVVRAPKQAEDAEDLCLRQKWKSFVLLFARIHFHN